MEDPDPAALRNQYRQRAYDIVEDETLGYAEKRDRLIEIGREFLGVENGHVERIDEEAGVHEVTASSNAREPVIPEGAHLDGAKTFCRRTVERNSSLALSNVPEQGLADDPARQEHGLDCYLGATIIVNGETYGTVCFVNREPRPEAFAPAERSFVELIARMLGREREREIHETELARRTRALDTSRHKYETLLSTAPDAIFLVNTTTQRVEEANDAAADLVGYEREDLIGTTFTDFHPPADHERYRRALREFARTEEIHRRLPDGSPLYLRHRDGTDIPVEVSVNAIELDGQQFVQGIFRDITERRAREKELRVKSRAIDAASVGITIADVTAPDAPLIYANEEFERLTGHGRTDAVGRNCRFLQGEHTDPESVAALAEAIEAERPVREELLNYRADGTPFWNELTLTPVEDDRGETTHFVGFQRDITQRRRRTRIIGVLNRVLRHNLRNDVMILGGLVEQISERSGEASRELATQIDEVLQGLTALSEKSSTLERAVNDPAPSERIDVADVVSETTSELETAHPDAGIRTDLRTDRAALASHRLRLALEELGENAIEYSRPDPSVTFRVEEAEDCIVVSVADDGPGMPEMERQVLRTGRETSLNHGQGLGLWLVNWIATESGGRVKTTVENGTTVSLYLDAADGETGSNSREAALGHGALRPTDR